ncbi:photosystem II 5 kDa protein, chloroplastic-like [Sesbania bispinosa]|nr:photosystem II 5 kDa protein, chloroplastic-like [Sesbania bispinosa]
MGEKVPVELLVIVNATGRVIEGEKVKVSYDNDNKDSNGRRNVSVVAAVTVHSIVAMVVAESPNLVP